MNTYKYHPTYKANTPLNLDSLIESSKTLGNKLLYKHLGIASKLQFIRGQYLTDVTHDYTLYSMSFNILNDDSNTSPDFQLHMMYDNESNYTYPLISLYGDNKALMIELLMCGYDNVLLKKEFAFAKANNAFDVALYY